MARALFNGLRSPAKYDPHADLRSPAEAFSALYAALSPKQRRAAGGEWVRRTRHTDSETHAAEALYNEIVVPLATTRRFQVSDDPETCQRAALEHIACGYDGTRIWSLACALADMTAADLAAIPEEERTPDQRRQTDPHFHARAIKKRARFAHAHADVVLGLVGGKRGRAVVSDEVAEAYEEQQARTREWLAGSYAVPLDAAGTPDAIRAMPMADIADRATAARNARRYTQALGMQEVARRLGWRVVFITLTLPAEFHVGATKGRRGDPKNTSEHAAMAMQGMWHRAVNLFQKWSIPLFAFIVAEFHDSSTLHRHVIACVPEERIDDVATALTGGPMPDEGCDGCRHGVYIDDWNLGPYRSDVKHAVVADDLRKQARAVRAEIQSLLADSREALAGWTRQTAREMSARHGGTKDEMRTRWHAQHLALVARERELLDAFTEASDNAVRGAFAASRINIRVLQPEGDVLLDRAGQPMPDARGEPKRAASLASYILPYLNPALCPEYAAAAWAHGVRRSSMVGLRAGLQADWHYLYTSDPDSLADMPLAQHVARALSEQRYGDALLDMHAFTAVGFVVDAEGPTHTLQPVREERVGRYGEAYQRRAGVAEVAVDADADCPHVWRRDYGVESTRPFTPPAVAAQLGTIRRGGLHVLVTAAEHAALTGAGHLDGAEVAAALQAQHTDKAARRCERSRTSAARLYAAAWATLDWRNHNAPPPLPLPLPPLVEETTATEPLVDDAAADTLAEVRRVFPGAMLIGLVEATPVGEPSVQLRMSYTRGVVRDRPQPSG